MSAKFEDTKVNFEDFVETVIEQFESMKNEQLFVTDVDKDMLWEEYLDSFPKGTNNIRKERREYDCVYCKQFIRNFGNVVAIIDDKIVTIWDKPVGGYYGVVSEALSQIVKTMPIKNVYLNSVSVKVGIRDNIQLLTNGDKIKWNHFAVTVPSKYLVSDNAIGTTLGEARTNYEMLLKSLNEINVDAMETVLELIDQNSIYRGEEHRNTITSFNVIKNEYDNIENVSIKHQYVWLKSQEIGYLSRVKNTVIGTLLVDLSNGESLTCAVKKFESKVAPSNYKRPTALVTKKMIENAQKQAKELGIEDSLYRRFATPEDVTINNVLFADRSVKPQMSGVFDELIEDIKVDVNKFDKVEDVPIGVFVKNIIPKAEKIELLFDNKHRGNLMSIIAPTIPDAKKIFKWDNNFSWSYNGNVADSMKVNVKNAGGNVDGVLRFSIQWNDENDNNDDLDVHCVVPSGEEIYYGHMRSRCGGKLDVDIVRPENKVAVENITWANKSDLVDGTYKFHVNNYTSRGGKSGFTAEIEYDGDIYSYVYDKPLKNRENVNVAVIEYSKEKGITFINSLKNEKASTKVWNIDTQKFQKVTMVMDSPNHWDEKATGNKHHFFIIDGCVSEVMPRGIYNEFLMDTFTPHRKVFEMLGAKLKVENDENQLSGLGFSSTQRNSILCRVTSGFTRVINIKF